MPHRVVKNVGNGPVVVSPDGHTVNPGDWTVVVLNEQVQAAVAAGQLVDKTDRITQKSDYFAWEAKKEAMRLDRAEAARPVDKYSATTMSDEAASPAAESPAAQE